jgi:hypothetical protein
MRSSSSSFVAILTLALFLLFSGSVNAQLSTNYYSKSCPKLLSTVKSIVQSAIAKEARMGASLLRLFFHDCVVNVIFCFSFNVNFQRDFFWGPYITYLHCMHENYDDRDATAPFSLMMMEVAVRYNQCKEGAVG